MCLQNSRPYFYYSITYQTQFCNFLHCSQPAVKLVFQTYEVILIIAADVTVTKIFAFEIGWKITTRNIKDITTEYQLHSIRWEISGCNKERRTTYWGT